ncbi:MAG: DEAD/DEAH box helicase [Synergistaceae bacterium]|jgi:superfamily II DNA or RNA helicase|nr:DEAD/DEAH box helicase [Synergistaceae bacterium]
MFFDEAKREKLMNSYYELTSQERRACRVLSALYAPIVVTKLARVLNATDDKNLPSGVKWDAKKNLGPLLERWDKLGLVRKIPTSHDSWMCNKLISEPLAREALSLGEFKRFCDVIAKQHDISGTNQSWYEYHFDSKEYYIRELRGVIYLGNETRFKTLIREGRYIFPTEFTNFISRDIPLCPPLTEILFNPLDEKLVMELPPDIASAAIYETSRFFSGLPDKTNAVKSLLEKFIERHPGYLMLEREAMLDMLQEGRFDDAERLIASSREDDAQNNAIRATIAVARGDPDGAYELFESGIKRIRKETGKRKVAFHTWCGVLYPILMVRSGAQAKKIIDYVNAAVDFNPNTEAALLMAKSLTAQGTERQKIFSQETINFVKNREIVYDTFFFALFAYWIDQAKARKHIALFAKTCANLNEMGMTFLASELASIIRELSPKETSSFSALPEPAFPLKNLLCHQNDWELSLSALSNLGVPSMPGKKAGAKRLIWRIDWYKGSDGKPVIQEIVPVEQSLQPRGWSSGKDVSLSRLRKNPNAVSSLTEQDRSAITAIREERGFYGAHFFIDGPMMLRLLSRHPLLFKSGMDEGVEISTDEPRLSAISSGGSYILRIDPYPNEQEMEAKLVLFEDSHNCLRLVLFEEKHLRMAVILGPKGLVVPESARDSVLKTLGGLSSVVTVHSDIAGIESGADVVEADRRLYIQLQPAGEGLDVEAVTRPLGSGSAPCRPGIGGENIFGLRDGRRVQARRDILGEADALSMLIGSCRTLSDAEQTSENRWSLDDAELSLEFLLQLRDAPEIVVEWPKGGDRSVKRLDPSSMNLSIRNSREWFAVSGEIKVDEGVVWNMKQIVRLLDVSKGRFIPLGNDRFVALTDEFRRRLEDLSSVGEMKGEELRISPISIAALSPIADEVGSFEGGGEWMANAALIDEAAAMNPDPPSAFKGELRGYQLDGFRWLARLAHWGAGACLADDMGLGKTIQTLALLLSRGPDGPALVVAPTSVCPNWVEEASRFAPALRVVELRSGDRETIVSSLDAMDVLVASYGLLQSEQQLLCGLQWHTIILDEAQAIKNMGTKRSAAAMKLGSDFRVVTTGTPIENNLGELWNLFRFINPHYLGSLDSFNSKFAAPIERDGDKRARKRLKRIIAPFILRRTKAQVLTELPPKTEITLRVEMKEEERAVYEAVRRNALEELESSWTNDKRLLIFAQLVKLRRACCNSALVLQGADVPRPSAKLDAFSEVMEELRAGGHRALVFSQFVDHLSIIRRRLEEMGVEYRYLDGSTPSPERARLVKDFQSGGGDCFLISLRAGGTGLNLTSADYVIHMDPWWNPAVEEQASDRTHRIGQERPVTVYRIVTKDTIEERIVDLHGWKRDLAESLLDEAEAPTRLSADDMLRLIRGE